MNKNKQRVRFSLPTAQQLQSNNETQTQFYSEQNHSSGLVTCCFFVIGPTNFHTAFFKYCLPHL